jgi:hypothetical protein
MYTRIYVIIRVVERDGVTERKKNYTLLLYYTHNNRLPKHTPSGVRARRARVFNIIIGVGLYYIHKRIPYVYFVRHSL